MRLVDTFLLSLVATLSITSACIVAPADDGDDDRTGRDRDDDDDNDDNDDDDARGFSACGDTTCQPGTYCVNASLSACDAGCTSDLNCTADSRCTDNDFSGVGTCAETTGPVEPEPEPEPEDTLAACQAACDHFQGCGLSAAETARCRSDCSTISANQQAAVANCDGVSCVSVTECLGVECLSDDDCGSDEQCLDYTCL